jgi:hypothetical protein
MQAAPKRIIFKTSRMFLLAASCLFLSPVTPAMSRTVTTGTSLQEIERLTVSPDDYKKGMTGIENSRLGLDGYKKLLAEGKVVVIDVRNKEAFEREHIKGSINLPLTDMTEKTLPPIAPDKKTPVVLVCDYSLYPTRMMPLSMEAYPVLKVNGYEKIYQLNIWNDPSRKKISSPEDYKKEILFEGSATQPKEEPKPQPTAFTCTPDSFKLTQNADKIFHLQGTLETGSSGYTYTYESRPDYNTYDIIRLVKPKGMALTVISTLDIDAASKRDFSKTPSVKIEVVKNFNWGPTEIICTQTTQQQK